MLTLHWHCWHCLDKVKPWLCSDCDVILFHMDYFHQSTDSWDLHRIKAQTKCMSWTRISRWSWLWTGQWILPFCVSVMWTGPHAFTEWEETCSKFAAGVESGRVESSRMRAHSRSAVIVFEVVEILLMFVINNSINNSAQQSEPEKNHQYFSLNYADEKK